MKNVKEIISSEWFDKVLSDVGFFNEDNPYPASQYGMIKFLEIKNIKVVHYKKDGGWMYVGIDLSEDDDFTQDFNVYEDFDTCVDTSIVECMCYLSNNLKHND